MDESKTPTSAKRPVQADSSSSGDDFGTGAVDNTTTTTNTTHKSRPLAFVDSVFSSFKPHPSHNWRSGGGNVGEAGAAAAVKESSANNARTYDAETAAENAARDALARRLKGRHITMLSLGGAIGTGLFVGSGSALATGGPASLLLGFAVMGIMIFCVVHSLGELAVAYPIAGSFSAYSTRFIDPSWGFAMGWNYAILWLTTLPLETVAATLTIQYWTHGSINNDAWVAIFLAVVVAINLFGVKGYGEAEFVITLIKVTAIIGFIILGIILVCGGGPQGGYIGARYYYDPGAFHNGFKGFVSLMVTAAFAFSGTELVGLAAAETANPRKSLPSAVKQVFWRIMIFYIISLLLVGLLVPYTDDRLINGSSSADASASPFVIAIDNAGISVLPSIINVVIMLSVMSVANSGVYASSRTLAAMANLGQAPRILGYIDRERRPIIAILFTSVFGLLAFLAGSSAQTAVFNWLLALSGLCALFNWASIVLAHIRFRQAWKHHGRSLDELAYRSPVGVWGSAFALLIIFLVLVAQFWVGFAPVGYASMTASERVQSFFLAYLAAPLIALFYIVHKVWYRTKMVKLDDIRLDVGLAEYNVKELIDQERAEKAQWGMGKKVWKFLV